MRVRVEGLGLGLGLPVDVLPLLQVHVQVPARGVRDVGRVPRHIVREDELRRRRVVEGQRRAVMLEPDGLGREVDRVLGLTWLGARLGLGLGLGLGSGLVLGLTVVALEALGPALGVRVLTTVRHHLGLELGLGLG